MRRWVKLKTDGFIVIRAYSNSVVRIFHFTEIAKRVLSENAVWPENEFVVFCAALSVFIVKEMSRYEFCSFGQWNSGRPKKKKTHSWKDIRSWCSSQELAVYLQGTVWMSCGAVKKNKKQKKQWLALPNSEICSNTKTKEMQETKIRFHCYVSLSQWALQNRSLKQQYVTLIP